MANSCSEISLFDCFGCSKDYYLLAVQSSFSLFPLAAQLQNLLNNEVRYIGNVKFDNHQQKPSFAVFHADIQLPDKVDLFLMENKSFNYVVSESMTSQDSYSLFEDSLFQEPFYYFNAGRSFLYKWKLKDVPYLFLLSVEKSTDIGSIMLKLDKLSSTAITNMSDIIGGSKKNGNNLRDLFGELDMMAFKAQIRHAKNYLTGQTSIPNLVAQKYEHVYAQKVSWNFDLIPFLQGDQTFERSVLNSACFY